MPNGLKCFGAGRDAENPKAIVLYFNRPVTDAELRYLHDVAKRAAECTPKQKAGAHLQLVKEGDPDA